MEPADQRTLKTINLYAIITFIGFLIGFLNSSYIGGDFPWYYLLCFFIANTFVFIFNSLKKYRAACLTFMININISIFFIVEYYDERVGNYLFYFPLLICIALLRFSTENLNKTLSLYAMSICFLVVAVVVDIPGFRNHNIPEHTLDLLFRYNLIIVVIVTAILIYLLIRLINEQSQNLIKVLETQKLNEKRITNTLKEKEILLAEIHHRVKNNLAVISSLLNLQLNNTNNEETREILTDSRNRVISMSLVHEKLYRNNDFSKIDFSQYVVQLVSEIVSGFDKTNSTRINIEADYCELNISKAIPVGLIVNEVVTNIMKHAFTQTTEDKKIDIRLSQHSNEFELMIKDNGCGFPGEFYPEHNDSLGIILISSLVEQVDGKIEMRNEEGALVNLSFNG